MLQKHLFTGLSIVAAIALTSCTTQRGPKPHARIVTGESFVLAGTEPAHFAFNPIRPVSIRVRSTYRDGLTNTVQYQPGSDYLISYDKGEISRTVESRIPDYRTNMLYGQENFDHSKFPGFGNNKFFVFVDYVGKQTNDWPVQERQTAFLPRTVQKLQAGAPLKIVAFGDSITAAADLTDPSLVFWQRWANYLQRKYPKAKIEAINGATGGDTTRNGLDRLQNKVLSAKPDLVLIGFGMNDHNINGTPLETFEKNLGSMIDQIRKETGAEVILYSTFPPNPKWRYGSHNMEAYALATEKVAHEKHCAFADVYHNWVAYAANKKPEDMLANNINHPNDFSHSIYLEVFRRLGL